MITIRTGLNFVHGFGPVFNVDERVQAYTHPLWFFAVSALGASTGSWFRGPMLLGLACTTLATAIVMTRYQTIGWGILATASLALSNAFTEYATSGLENSLTYLLIAGLWVTYTRLLERPGPAIAGLTGVTASLVMLNRLDVVLMIGLPLAVVLLRHHVTWRMRAIVVVAAAVPLASWFMWAWSYYGWPLPNTFAAKTNADISRRALIGSGLHYLTMSMRHDPVTLVALLAALATMFLVPIAISRAWAIGILLYVGYVVWIGGDFMAGRFFAVPLFVGILGLVSYGPLLRDGSLFARSPKRTPAVVHNGYNAAAPVTLGVGLLLLGLFGSRVFDADLCVQRWVFLEPPTPRGVAPEPVSDEAAFYRARGLALGGAAIPYWDAVVSSWPDASSTPRQPVATTTDCGLIGSVALAAGARVHAIDTCGLTDAFIARLPYSAAPGQFRIGHFVHVVPDGYTEAILTNDPNKVTDPNARKLLTSVWRRIR